jgi:hypothetical protein
MKTQLGPWSSPARLEDGIIRRPSRGNMPIGREARKNSIVEQSKRRLNLRLDRRHIISVAICHPWANKESSYILQLNAYPASIQNQRTSRRSSSLPRHKANQDKELNSKIRRLQIATLIEGARTSSLLRGNLTQEVKDDYPAMCETPRPPQQKSFRFWLLLSEIPGICTPVYDGSCGQSTIARSMNPRPHWNPSTSYDDLLPNATTGAGRHLASAFSGRGEPRLGLVG